MRLHRDVGVQMVQRTIRLLTSVPPTLVHPLNLLIPTTGPLVLLRARDGNKGVYLEKALWMSLGSFYAKNR